MLAEVSEVNGCVGQSWHVERSRERLARTCQAKSSEAAAAIGTELAQATEISELRDALSLSRCSGRASGGSSAKASSSPPPSTTPPYTTLTTHPPLLRDSPISASSPPLTSDTALGYPYSTNPCARSQSSRLQHQPTTRRTRSLTQSTMDRLSRMLAAAQGMGGGGGAPQQVRAVS